MPGWLTNGPFVNHRVDFISHAAERLPDSPLFAVRQLGDRARPPVPQAVLRVALVAAVRDPLAGHAHSEAPALVQRGLPADGAHLNREGAGDVLPVDRRARAVGRLDHPHVISYHLDDVATCGHDIVPGEWCGHVELEEGGAVAILPRRQVLAVCPTLAVAAEHVAVPPRVVGPRYELDLGGHPPLAAPPPLGGQRVVQRVDLHLAHLHRVGLVDGDSLLLRHLGNRYCRKAVLHYQSARSLSCRQHRAPDAPSSAIGPCQAQAAAC
mmetsp:Transcript_132401/g.411605  ORF Transcript_132401/g.411605 Transcript_132401/m.411605 type:complete len:267 (+) Transcript_132401:904-1704(+)